MSASPTSRADGRAVVFATNRTGHYCLWSIALDGGVETQLTEETGEASYPAVSEHGLVAYVLARAGEWSIRVLGSDGVISVAHTSSSRLSAPTWRPGGGVLVFGEQDSTETSRLQMLLLGEPHVLKSLSDGEDLFASRAAWRSAAEFIYAADGQLWRRGIATPTREPVHLFAAAAVEVAVPPTDIAPFDAPGERSALGVNGVARSPDGRSTAFTALGDLWLAERGEPRRLTNDEFVDLDPTFWPDGESLVFASERTGQFELWRLTLRDGKLVQLTFGALEPRRPAVRPDGNSIAYLESTSLEPRAATVLKTLDWRRREDTTVATNVVGATALAWSEDGRALAVQATAADAVNPRDFRVDVRTQPPSSDDAGRGAAAAPLAGAGAAARLRRRDRPPIRRCARHVPPARRPARAGRAHRRNRPARRAASQRRGHRRPRRDGHTGAHRCSCPPELARRRAARSRLASVRSHDGTRAHDDAGGSHRACRDVGQRPVAWAALGHLRNAPGSRRCRRSCPRLPRNRPRLRP